MTPTNNENLGRALREARLARGITIAQLARDISASPSNLSLIELGRGSPSTRTLARVCEALGLDLEVAFTQMKKKVTP